MTISHFWKNWHYSKSHFDETIDIISIYISQINDNVSTYYYEKLHNLNSQFRGNNCHNFNERTFSIFSPSRRQTSLRIYGTAEETTASRAFSNSHKLPQGDHSTVRRPMFFINIRLAASWDTGHKIDAWFSRIHWTHAAGNQSVLMKIHGIWSKFQPDFWTVFGCAQPLAIRV